MTGLVLGSAPGYTLWLHETGTDRIEASSVNPISSYFQTAEISMLTAEQAKDTTLRVARVEPDFVQAGNMTMEVAGRQNARSDEVTSTAITFADIAGDPQEETLKMKEVRRLMSFKFSSNTVGGNYEMGEPVAHIAPDDSRVQT
jgi:hypothetical protein